VVTYEGVSYQCRQAHQSIRSWEPSIWTLAGTPGKRSVLRHAKVTLHQPSGQARGTLPDLAVEAKEVAKVRAEMDQILAEHTGHSIATIREDTDRRMTLTAAEAVAYGLADRVITRRESPGYRLTAA
ncbi:ATP-dependent Clp protease proteolytic subunit, partial [Actinoplanes philippinensis]|uniref:ATP-dependent Clp protease proteolytic subunit n=1 Tax=Actinoplanes philippinensis TaxID=35752 RepID=UPI0033CB7F7D